MLSYLRGKRTSKVVLGFVTIVMAAFAFAGVGYRSMGGFGGIGGGVSEDSVATVDGTPITNAVLKQRVDLVVRQAQGQNPSASEADFVAGGGFEPLLDQTVDAALLEAFGRRQGLVVGKRLVDSQIAAIPAFQVGGKFDEATFRLMLQQQHVSEAQLRSDLAGDMIRRQLLIPMVNSTQLPKGVAALYASLLLETRDGLIGIVPTSKISVDTPGDAELAAYYKKNIAHYTMPERRVLRYAIVNAEQVPGPAPSEADIARTYQANAASYAAVQKRKLEQVVLPDQAQAQAFATKVKGGTSFAKAAADAGFGAVDIELGEQTRKAFADLTSGAVADAAFGAAKGAVTAPANSAFGWHVVEVQSIDDTPGRSLADVHDEISKSLAKQQTDQRLVDFANKLQEAADGGSSFDDIVRQNHLTASDTPPITADGRDPEQKDYALPTDVRPLLKAGFEAGEGDRPTVEALGSGQNSALLSVGHVLAAAPIPLAKVHDQLLSDFKRERAQAKAEQLAKTIVAKVDSGTSMDKAFADANMPPPQKAGGRRADLAKNGARVPPPLAFLFTLPSGATRSLAAPNDQGYLIVHVSKITPGDARSDPGLVDGARTQLSTMLAEEYASQFANAAAAIVKVRRDNRAIAQLKAQLAGTAPAAQ